MLKNEKEERSRLKSIILRLGETIAELNSFVKKTAGELQAQKSYIWENRGEKNSMSDSLVQSSLSGEAVVSKREKLRKLADSPYFGRIDFNSGAGPQQVYIGVHAYSDPVDPALSIYDWRAPISSMYYRQELGGASYESPSGEVQGLITLKRQYRIRKGEMEFMFENSSAIGDEVLQLELSRASDEKMKNIIATIQADQNAIIRDETSRVLLIQGVAGSGKTSIALHRIAFLLYRFKGEIRSENIMILSPNKVFADYISNVLPELGEERIPEMGIDELARRAFEDKLRFQSFFDQVSLLLEKKDPDFAGRIRFKATADFLSTLNTYLTHIGNTYFEPGALGIGRYSVSEAFLKEKFEAAHRLPIMKRFAQVAQSACEEVRFRHRYEVTGKEKNEIKKKIEKMFRLGGLKNIYRDFYRWLGEEGMLKTARGGLTEYSDVFPMLYLKIMLEGNMAYPGVYHLLIDEMQDYTPVQYAVISKIFPCKKTILGDVGQSVNPYSSCDLEGLQRAFPGAALIKLNRSYRSTVQITAFSQKISPNSELIAMQRNGPQPGIFAGRDRDEEIDNICAILEDFRKSAYKSMGIICKGQDQARAVWETLTGRGFELSLLGAESTRFREGITVTSAHLSKGLEFDCVILPFLSRENYATGIDKNMLYVGCTRAMHELNLTYHGKASTLLPRRA